MEEEAILKELENIVESEGDAIGKEWRDNQFALVKQMGEQLSNSNKKPMADGAYMLIAERYKGDGFEEAKLEALNYDKDMDMNRNQLAHVHFLHKFGSLEAFMEIASDASNAMHLHVLHNPVAVFIRLFLGKNKFMDVFAQDSCVTVRRKTRFVDEFFAGHYDDDKEFKVIQKALSDDNLELVKNVVGMLKIPDHMRQNSPDMYNALKERMERNHREHDDD